MPLPLSESPYLIHKTASLAGSDAAEAQLSDSPILAHSLRHDKSILALAVSSSSIFAAFEGGEILVLNVSSKCIDSF
jgi:di- and tripeptidase